MTMNKEEMHKIIITQLKVIQKDQQKEIEVLKEFIDELINHSYMYGSDYYDSGMVLLNKTEDDE